MPSVQCDGKVFTLNVIRGEDEWEEEEEREREGAAEADYKAPFDVERNISFRYSFDTINPN